MKKINWISLLTSIFIAELVGALSALLSGNSGELYSSFKSPPLSPPGWIFPVVWAILYALMGIAAYLVYESDANPAKKQEALKFYAAQLAVNFLWSIVFFRFQAFWAAVIVILTLVLLVILTMIKFWPIQKAAVWFLVPYLLWILFATYLAIGVAVLN